MTNTEELYHVTELTPAVFAANKRVSLCYMLTLMLHREGKDRLFLTSPGFVPALPCELEEMEAVIQIELSDLLFEVFLTRHFLPTGQFLRQGNGIRLFSSCALMQVKELLLHLRTDRSEKTSLQFLWAMKELAESNPEQLTDAVLLTPGSIRNAVKINKIRSYVENNYQKPLRLKDVAGLVGYTRTSLSRFFTQCTGMSFSEYFIWVRIEKAARLLRTTDDTVMSIGLSCGFSSPCYFSRTFKQHKGLTPGEVRTFTLRSPEL